MKNVLLVMVVFVSFIGSAQAKEALPGPLVDVEWLTEHSEDVVLLDVRKDLDSFTRVGHIPNATLVDVKEIRTDRVIDGMQLTRMLPDAADFERFMQAHGIANDSQVVITHPGKKSGDVAGAARLYWQLKYYSFERVALLDGGNAAWSASLEDLTTEASNIHRGNYRVGDTRPEILATMDQVQQSFKDGSVTLIDTRDLRYHVGIEKKDYVFAYGHIPGSRSLPYKFLNPAKGDAIYFDLETIRGISDSMGIDTDDPLILYCNSAYEASSVWFALHEILGKNNVRIFDGSLHQWTQNESNPMTARLTQ